MLEENKLDEIFRYQRRVLNPKKYQRQSFLQK